ncbi:hypothetical protein BJY21_002990 [Kineosphaera limosa]|uniref:Integral membrane protein n=1 Tax=Kineosphaera limosa NBRC 100340 TaxID=1184609 RepID=K6WZ39_9MICO|nr:hypothetical protein [Kineosphaera limosa]NYE01806.1 hypothetical protein [Kineosphaera limosa]GAB97357.1 hypothetical protein KILIM_065_00350 [Kineosphaera limosa NBRC 100340]
MAVLYTILVIAHWGGVAALIAGYTLSVGSGVINPVMVWGARIQLLVGLALVGVGEMTDHDFNHAKIGVKLVLALAVVVLAEISRARAKRGAGQPVLTHAAAGAAVVNALVALLWN